MSLAHNWRAVVRNVCPTLKRVFTAFLLPDSLKIDAYSWNWSLKTLEMIVWMHRVQILEWPVNWSSRSWRCSAVALASAGVMRLAHTRTIFSSIRGSMGNRDRSPGSLLDRKFPSLARQDQQVKKTSSWSSQRRQWGYSNLVWSVPVSRKSRYKVLCTTSFFFPRLAACPWEHYWRLPVMKARFRWRAN